MGKYKGNTHVMEKGYRLSKTPLLLIHNLFYNIMLDSKNQ